MEEERECFGAEGGWKRGILWLDVMHGSVCVHCVAQVSGFYLSEGRQ